MFSVLFYFTYILTGVQGSPGVGFNGGKPLAIVLRWFILIFTIFFIGLEIDQFV
jgi:hypothetical protein